MRYTASGASLGVLPSFGPQSLANLSWSLAVLVVPDVPLLDGVARHTQRLAEKRLQRGASTATIFSAPRRSRRGLLRSGSSVGPALSAWLALLRPR